MGAHIGFSLVFLSNIKFWREAGYFDAVSHEKWLLHTWSLAVEWQFYLLLPLVLLAVWKWRPGRGAITGVMLAGFLISLGLSMGLTPSKPGAAFYLLPTRAWEMLAGGLVYLLAHQWTLNARQCRVLETTGLGLVLTAVVGFNAASAWPGWRAAVPVLGTVLVLLAARDASRWTGHPLAQWLGTRSYSLYLWHWPIVVALVYLELSAAPVAICAGLLLTLVLGHWSYRWVETSARRQLSQLRPGWGVTALVSATFMVAAPAAGVRFKEGVMGRFSQEIELVSQEALNRNPRQEECHPGTGTVSPSCLFGGQQLRAIVIGDSHANAVVSALAAAAPNPEDGVMELSYSGCPTLLGVLRVPARQANAAYQCDLFLDWAQETITKVEQTVPLVIVNRTTAAAVGANEPWEKNANRNMPVVYFTQVYTTATPAFLAEFAERLTDTACQLAKNRTVYLMRPVPEMGVDVPKTARAMVWGQHQEVSISLAEYHQRHAFVWAAQDAAHARCGVQILDPLPYLCWDGRCHGAKDGRPLYYDDDHLSEFGNKLLVPMFAKVFEKI